ncbi:DUF6162 family protein [Pseudomonas sp. NPDC077186]|uniref:DUF6162 family protein n=1 Tax=Pseudomonas sp. NPDC077186 TaxID=3364421 RepID=UPI0037C8354A
MTTQVVRPAGAGHESLQVLLLSLAILALAALVIVWRSEPTPQQEVAGHQLDARRDLNAAEQGIHTDLSVALDEIRLLQEEQQSLPSPEMLAQETLPPFADDSSARTRGAHHWQLLQLGDQAVYLGLSGDVGVAGSFLLFPAHEGLDIWLNRNADATAPTDLQTTALADAGWKQVAVQYDAGVTREHRH